MKSLSSSGINDKTKLIGKQKINDIQKRWLNDNMKGFLNYVKENSDIVVDDEYIRKTK